MSRRWLAGLAIVVFITLLTPALMADKGKSQGKANPHAPNSYQSSGQGWENRDGYEYRVYANPDERPPGWSHGKKTGWGNCGLPPGQAKKYGCRTYVYQGPSPLLLPG